ncbi:hypothetical protein HDU87_000111 [Geranomyces variabilis]|uniref:Response regulatory domain-containing protein n=1 Tax=Geranomyces variabilis TaxID=109894 RepID=A0AAD5XRH0_9FUNG|nr:hypothetical protein HDU87_000111 [Geranomyces variabilis]
MFDGHPLRVAVVDDNPIMQQIMVRTLNKYMHIQIHSEDVFTDGLSLLKALTLRRYDLILLDIEMPIMDGLQATLRIRNPGENPESASVRHNLKHDLGPSSSSSASSPHHHHRPTTPSPTVRQMRYALTPTGAGSTTEAVDNLAQNILEANRRVPIIAVTANAFLDQQRRHCLAVGMTDVVSKPIAPAQIMEIMRRYLDSEPESRVHLSVDELTDRLVEKSSDNMADRDGETMGAPSRGPRGGNDHSLNTTSSHARSPAARHDRGSGRRGSSDDTAGAKSARTLWSQPAAAAGSPTHGGKGSLYKDADDHHLSAQGVDDHSDKDRHRAHETKGTLHHGSFPDREPESSHQPRHKTKKKKGWLYNDHDGHGSGDEVDSHGEENGQQPPQKSKQKASLYNDNDYSEDSNDEPENGRRQPSSTSSQPRQKVKQKGSLYNNPYGDNASDGLATDGAEDKTSPGRPSFARDTASAARSRPASLYHSVNDENADNFPLADELRAHYQHHYQPPLSTHLPPQTVDQKRASYRTFPLEEDEEPADLACDSPSHPTPTSRFSNANLSSQRAANAEHLYAQLMSDHNADLERESCAAAASAGSRSSSRSVESSRQQQRKPSPPAQIILPPRSGGSSGQPSPHALSAALAAAAYSFASARSAGAGGAGANLARASITSAASGHSDVGSDFSGGAGERRCDSPTGRRCDSPTGMGSDERPKSLPRGRVSQRSSLSSSSIIAGSDSSTSDVRRRHTSPANRHMSPSTSPGPNSPESTLGRSMQPSAPPSAPGGAAGPPGVIRRASSTRKR